MEACFLGLRYAGGGSVEMVGGGRYRRHPSDPRGLKGGGRVLSGEFVVGVSVIKRTEEANLIGNDAISDNTCKYGSEKEVT